MGCGGSAEKYEASFLQVTDTSASLKEPGSKPTIAPAVVAGARWTAPAAPAEVALAPAAEEASTRPPVERNAPKGAWLVETAPETWEELPADVGATLTAALHANQPVALYTVHGAKPSQDVSYDVDFRQLLRRDRGSGRQQRLRWDPTWAPRLGAAGAISAADPGGDQWELKNGTWADFEDEELQHLVRAWMMGHDQAERRSRYKALCLKWHPDKNLDSEDTATEVFQFLQLLRDWYLA